MPRYQVIGREVQFYIVEIEADDDDAAEQAANELEAQEFEYLDGGDWEIVSITAIPPTKKNQLTLF